jgi:hypothetical protein
MIDADTFPPSAAVGTRGRAHSPHPWRLRDAPGAIRQLRFEAAALFVGIVQPLKALATWEAADAARSA